MGKPCFIVMFGQFPPNSRLKHNCPNSKGANTQREEGRRAWSCALKKAEEDSDSPTVSISERGHTISSVKAEFSELNQQVVMVASALGNDVRDSGR